MTRPFGPEPEDLADVNEAAEAAASVRFQPAEDTSVCPACYHAPHWGMCGLCLCFKVHAQGGDEPVGEPDLWPSTPTADWFEREQPTPDAEPEPPRGRHRREVPKSSKLARLRKMWRRG